MSTDSRPIRRAPPAPVDATPTRTRALGESRRRQVCPPSLRGQSAGVWRRLWGRLLRRADRWTSPPPDQLGRVQADFQAALADLGPLLAAGLRRRVARAATLRELWHLRAEVFHAVGLAHGQAEAALRLAALNRHFPPRTPRAGAAPSWLP